MSHKIDFRYEGDESKGEVYLVAEQVTGEQFVEIVKRVQVAVDICVDRREVQSRADERGDKHVQATQG